jgi:NADH-quinone oxidoreductase subunit C
MDTQVSTFKLDAPEGLIASTVLFRDEVTLMTTREKVLELLAYLKNEQQFNMLTDETCTDYFPKDPRFGIIYQLYSFKRNIRVRVKLILPEGDPRVPSACSVYINANWLEREIYDLFGIQFENHPDMRRILLPNDYVGHPLRKEIPVTVEENAFSFNRERIAADKPRATE